MAIDSAILLGSMSSGSGTGPFKVETIILQAYVTG